MISRTTRPLVGESKSIYAKPPTSQTFPKITVGYQRKLLLGMDQ